MRYKITTSSDDPHVIRERQQNAEGRLRQWFNLPHGVTVDEMAEIWQQMDFGGLGAEATPPFKPELFKKAGPQIKGIRKLAHKGRHAQASLEREQKGKGVVILGQ